MNSIVAALRRHAFWVGMFLGISGALIFGPDSNSRETYGDSGLPKNCRAIIAANIAGWRDGRYTSDGALGTIDRNCGRTGHSWGR